MAKTVYTQLVIRAIESVKRTEKGLLVIHPDEPTIRYIDTTVVTINIVERIRIAKNLFPFGNQLKPTVEDATLQLGLNSAQKRAYVLITTRYYNQISVFKAKRERLRKLTRQKRQANTGILFPPRLETDAPPLIRTG